MMFISLQKLDVHHIGGGSAEGKGEGGVKDAPRKQGGEGEGGGVMPKMLVEVLEVVAVFFPSKNPLKGERPNVCTYHK